VIRVAGPRAAAAAALLTGICCRAAGAAEPIATFSIVGFDSAAGELGVAVQSKFFAVGSVVPWARAGVGAVATQAFGNTTFGPRGLDLLAAGHGPAETLELLLADDEGRERRQVGIVDARGRTASHTGRECQPWAGHEAGASFTAQGNILAGEQVVAEMARAYRDTEGMLGEKLLRALEAGQAAGGDSRGMQSAAILVVKEKGGYGGFNDRYCDLRVDDHVEPIRELRRIFDLWKVQALILEGYRRVEEGAFDAAIRIGEEAVVLDASGESHYHLGCYLSRAGRKADALASLAEAVRRDASLGPRAATDPDFEPLRGDAEFGRLVEKGGTRP
jgi:uncharacterized Ntn-hydrolase superfamily protein